MSTAQEIRLIPDLPERRFVNQDELVPDLLVARYVRNGEALILGSQARVVEVTEHHVFWVFVTDRLQKRVCSTLEGFTTFPAEGLVVFTLPAN